MAGNAAERAAEPAPAAGDFWRAMGSAVVVGGLSGLSAFAFVQVVGLGTRFLWGDPTQIDVGGGEWWWIAAGLVAGLAVGSLRRALRVPDRLDGSAAIMTKGSVDTASAPAAVAVSAVSLIGGASLGPFDAGTRSGAAIGAWWSRRGRSEAQPIDVLNGVAGGLGGLLTAPVVATLLITELQRRTSREYLAFLVPNLVAAVVGFAVFYVTVGSSFLGIYAQDPYEVLIWHFGLAAGLGLVAAGVAWGLEKAVAVTARLAARGVGSLPVRAALGGSVVGLIAVVLPVTFGSGKQQLTALVDQPASIGVVLLLAVALGKVAAMAVSLGTGFIGGGVMPTLFLGGTLGLAVAEAMPAVPRSLAFSCMLVGVAATAMRAPLTMAVLVVLMTGLGPIEATPAVITTVVAYLARRGTSQAVLPLAGIDLPSVAEPPRDKPANTHRDRGEE